MDPLDNPIWNSLITEQTAFAERDGDAARFAPEVTALAGLRAPGADALRALARIVRDGEVIGVFADGTIEAPAPLTIIERARLAQMIHDGPAPRGDDALEVLSDADAPAMRALAAATKPGPFGLRTHELGTFLGIRDEQGALIAMAGQRMRLPGMIEISAVCTDPAHLGRGHAARLMTAQLARIHAAGATPFLHVRDINARAIALYERLGFRIRRRAEYVVMRSGS
jgi:GNAT superfamily N-acetyltransferase